MAPAKRQRTGQDEDSNDPIDLNTNDTPFGHGLSAVRTACSSLTTSFGTSLPILEEFAVTNLKLHRDIKRRQDTLKSLTEANKPARSIRFKFKLNGSNTIAHTDKFKELESTIDDPIRECQEKLQKAICATQKLEITQRQTEKSETCLSLLCFLAKALIIAKPEFKHVKPIQAIDSALGNVLISPLFVLVTEEESRIMLCHHFNEDIATIFEEELTIPTTQLANLLVTEGYKLLVHPQVQNDEQEEKLDRIRQLKALATSTATNAITEQVSMDLETEPTISAKRLEELIDKKMDAKTKEITATLKNAFGGNTSKASLKNALTAKQGQKASGNKAFTKKNVKDRNSQQKKGNLKPSSKSSPALAANAQAEKSSNAGQNENKTKTGKHVTWKNHRSQRNSQRTSTKSRKK